MSRRGGSLFGGFKRKTKPGQPSSGGQGTLPAPVSDSPDRASAPQRAGSWQGSRSRGKQQQQQQQQPQQQQQQQQQQEEEEEEDTAPVHPPPPEAQKQQFPPYPPPEGAAPSPQQQSAGEPSEMPQAQRALLEASSAWVDDNFAKTVSLTVRLTRDENGQLTATRTGGGARTGDSTAGAMARLSMSKNKTISRISNISSEQPAVEASAAATAAIARDEQILRAVDDKLDQLHERYAMQLHSLMKEDKPRVPDLLSVLQRLVDALQLSGDIEEAISLAEQRLQILTKVLSSRDTARTKRRTSVFHVPDQTLSTVDLLDQQADTFHSLGSLSRLCGDLQQAEEYLWKSIELRARVETALAEGRTPAPVTARPARGNSGQQRLPGDDTPNPQELLQMRKRMHQEAARSAPGAIQAERAASHKWGQLFSLLACVHAARGEETEALETEHQALVEFETWERHSTATTG